MKVILDSTDRIVEVNGVPGRVWEGVTAKGIRCYAVVTRIAAHTGDDVADFEQDLQECRPATPAALEAFPTRMVV